MNVPYLQPPGAGIPFWQRWVGYCVVRWVGRVHSRTQSQQDFIKSTQDMIDLCKRIPPSRRDEKILVPKQFGMEDSSRFWSVNLTLEHVMIVTKGITDIIIALSRNKNVPGMVRTADAKPQGVLQGDALVVFQDAMHECETRLQDVVIQASSKRHRHPWFGALNAAQWHSLLAMHNTIHHRQILQIARTLHSQSPLKSNRKLTSGLIE